MGLVSGTLLTYKINTSLVILRSEDKLKLGDDTLDLNGKCTDANSTCPKGVTIKEGSWGCMVGAKILSPAIKDCKSVEFKVDESYTKTRCASECHCDGARTCDDKKFCTGTARKGDVKPVCPEVKCAQPKAGCKSVKDDSKNDKGCAAFPCGKVTCTEEKPKEKDENSCYCKTFANGAKASDKEVCSLKDMCGPLQMSAGPALTCRDAKKPCLHDGKGNNTCHAYQNAAAK